MALFCATIRRDSVSLLRFPFLNHAHIFSCVMLFISRLKRPWSCFSSHFCFLIIVVLLVLMLSVSFLVAVINPSCVFLCSLRVVVSMRQRCIRCWQVLFLTSFLIHIVCQRHLWDVLPYVWSLVFFFCGPFACVLWSTSRMIPNILRGIQPRYLFL